MTEPKTTTDEVNGTISVTRRVTPEDAARQGLAAVSCPACGGTGIVGAYFCPRCKGKAQIVVKVRG